MCPGQNNKMLGKAYANHISEDVTYFAEQKVNLIICLLHDYELKLIGCDPQEYTEACYAHSIGFFKYPIADFEQPTNIPDFHERIVLRVNQALDSG